jgi:hypothetical protein
MAVTQDMASYLREPHCYHECIRLIERFGGQPVDSPLLERNINPCPRKRFCDIVIFISHFFGRAEVLLEVNQVRTLWDTLGFVDDFVKALEDQSRIMEAKANTKTEKSTKSTKAGEGSMGGDERDIKINSGKNLFDTTKQKQDVHISEGVSTKGKKRKGTEIAKKTKNPKMERESEPIGEEKTKRTAEGNEMTHSAVSAVSRDRTHYFA